MLAEAAEPAGAGMLVMAAGGLHFRTVCSVFAQYAGELVWEEFVGNVDFAGKASSAIVRTDEIGKVDVFVTHSQVRAHSCSVPVK